MKKTAIIPKSTAKDSGSDDSSCEEKSTGKINYNIKPQTLDEVEDILLEEPEPKIEEKSL